MLLHSLRELSYHPSLAPAHPPSFQLRHRAAALGATVGRTAGAAAGTAAAAVGATLQKSTSFRGGDELESRFEASKAVNFGVKEVYLTPFFASGKGFLTHLFDTLPVQFYFSPVVVRFVEVVVGHVLDVENPEGPGGGGGREGGRAGGGGGQLRRVGVPKAFLNEVGEREKAREGWGRCCSSMGSDEQDSPRVDGKGLDCSSGVSSSCSIDGEEEEEEEGEEAEEDDVSEPTFGVFVRYMLRTRGLLPFALHRYCPSSQQHYVVTMPRANLLLHSMDFAYVLTPAGPLTPQQEKAEAAAETAAAV